MKASTVRICVPICVPHGSDLAEAVARATQVGDIVELRLDCLAAEQLSIIEPYLPALLEKFRYPFIFTFRPAEQGGRRALALAERISFWQFFWGWKLLDGMQGSSAAREPSFADMEHQLLLACENDSEIDLDSGRIINSHHDFVGGPADLEKIYDSMANTPARMIKIAVQANDATDCIPVFRLLDRARREGHEMISIAMGQAGVMTRILGPSRGSFLTYGSLDDESATAPGQLTAKELREVYRIDRIDRQTEITGLMGQPVQHSVSPQIHNAALAAAGVNAVYIPFEVRDAGQFLRRMAHPRSRELEWNLRGLSVTAPHKTVVMNELDFVEPAAKEIGAVNTIVVQGKELHGHNTDTAGFISPLRTRFESLRNAHCAIIGAGGAARAALWVLRNEGAHVVLFARNPDISRQVAEQFGVECQPLEGASFEGFNLVVNATPLGTAGEREDESPATVDQLRGVRFAYDLVYNPIETRFLRAARAAGCETIRGVEMLVAQAVEQFKLWTGFQPDVEVMHAAALKALSQDSKVKHPASNIPSD